MTQPQQKKTRREMLQEFAAAHPNDPFALYGLAMECSNQGDNDAAIANFEKLLNDHPTYVSGYQMYGQLLARLARTDKAREVLLAGIQAARKGGNQHAAEEMEAALALLEPA
jgi:cytochrome c-type biogenesis protein CcmH/NrfG